jgi:hypothetical protein
MRSAVWFGAAVIVALGAVAACGDDETTTTSSGNDGGNGATGGGGDDSGGGGSGAQGGGGAPQGGGGSGGAPQGGGGAGGAMCVEFAAACTQADSCCDYAGETGQCYQFGMGDKCSIPCPPDPMDCPNNGLGCNNMNPPLCKVM